MKMARYCYRKAVHDNPSLSEAYFRIGETYKHEGLWEQAYKSFQKANELEKEQYDFCLAMAEAALEIGETEVSIDACETAMDIFVKRHEAYFILARIMAENGDMETAREILTKGREVCKSTTELDYALCAVAFLDNKLKEGEVLLRNLLAQDYTAHELLFEFSDELKNNAQMQQIIAEYN
jgi:tetratricopeptide (TPR) repeat protein